MEENKRVGDLIAFTAFYSIHTFNFVIKIKSCVGATFSEYYRLDCTELILEKGIWYGNDYLVY